MQLKESECTVKWSYMSCNAFSTLWDLGESIIDGGDVRDDRFLVWRRHINIWCRKRIKILRKRMMIKDKWSLANNNSHMQNGWKLKTGKTLMLPSASRSLVTPNDSAISKACSRFSRLLCCATTSMFIRSGLKITVPLDHECWCPNVRLSFEFEHSLHLNVCVNLYLCRRALNKRPSLQLEEKLAQRRPG